MKTFIRLLLFILLPTCTVFAQEYSDSARVTQIFRNTITISEPTTDPERIEKVFFQPETVQALFPATLTMRYLPNGIPPLSPTATLSVTFLNAGFGIMMFFDNVFLGTHVGVLQQWNISAPNDANSQLHQGYYLFDASVGYTVWKQNQWQITPSATIGVTRYDSDNNLFQYTSRYIGAEMNFTYILPITELRYKIPQAFDSSPSMIKEFSGTLDAGISLRIGYAHHFAAQFAYPTFGEIYVRFSIGIGLTRFEQP